MKKIIISLLLALGLATSSYAVSLEGLSVGISGSHSGYYAVGTEETDNDETGVDDTKEAGAFTANHMSVFLEYNVGPISVGLDYIPSEIETPKNTNLQGTTTNTVKGEFANHTTVYALIPIPLGGLYAKVGGIYVDLNSIENLGTGGSYGNTDTTGMMAGLGYSIEAADGLSIRAEVTAAQYEEVEVANSASDAGGTKVTLTDMMSAFGTISVVKSF